MIRSMTAFASSEKIEEKFSIVIEIRSYNHRYLDIALRVPTGYRALEDKIKSLVTDSVTRGRVEILVTIKEDIQDALAFEINEPKAAKYYDALVRLKEMLKLHGEIPLDLLAKQEDIIKPIWMNKDLSAAWTAVKGCLCEALNDLEGMRRQEGEALAKDFDKRLVRIEKYIDHIEKDSLDLMQHYQARLKERLSTLTKGVVNLEPERIMQEAAFLAERSDITEEIVRAKSHLRQFRLFMDSEEPEGRKLNFLLQELNREFNTIGSKTESANAVHKVVEVKSELEKMREQVMNVE
ncbi:MAG: YicC/YloC family endoribonuclease [Desulfobacterales bacterium]